MKQPTSEQGLHRLYLAQASREPEYHDNIAGAVVEVVHERDKAVRQLDDHDADCECVVPTFPICLGPGRCPTLDSATGCMWCMRYPMHEGASYVDTFLKIHERGH